MKVENYLYQVNLFKLSKDFKDAGQKDKYYHYVSKDFFGVKIRTVKPLEALDGKHVVMSVRYDGHDFDGKTGIPGRVTGVKVDLIDADDERIERFNIQREELPLVSLDIETLESRVAIIDDTYEKVVTLYDVTEEVTGVLMLVKEERKAPAY